MAAQPSAANLYLRSLQERFLRSGYAPRYPLTSPSLDDAERRSGDQTEHSSKPSIADLRRWYSDIAQIPLPTDLEDPAFFVIVKECISDVHKIAAEMGYAAASEISYGTLPTDDVNGMAIRPPQGEGVVVVLNHGLILALMEMATAIASFFPFKPSTVPKAFEFDRNFAELNRRFDENLEGHLAFVGAACSLIGLRVSVGSSDPIPSNSDPWRAARELLGLVLSDHSNMFVVAHEYAHVALNHLATNTVRHTIGNIQVEKVQRSWQQESDADGLGSAIVALHALKSGNPFAMTLAGTEFFLLCVDLLEKLLGIDHSPSHPPALRRRDRIRKNFESTYPDVAPAALMTGNIMEWIFDQAFKRNLIHIAKAVEYYAQKHADNAK